MSSVRQTNKRRRKLQLIKQRAQIVTVNGSVRNEAHGTYYVATIMSTGQLAPPVEKRTFAGATIPPQEGLIVELAYDTDGEQKIRGVNERAAQAQGVSAFALNPGELNSRLYYGEQIGTLLCRRHPTLPWRAQVLPGIAMFGDEPVAVASALTIDLSSYVPDEGEHRYVGVALKNDGTLIAAASTAQSTGTALDNTDLTEVAEGFTGIRLPLRAFVFDGDESDFSDSATTAKDLRSFAGPVLDINKLPAEASIDDAADYFVAFDASAGILVKVLGSNMPGGGAGTGDEVMEWLGQ